MSQMSERIFIFGALITVIAFPLLVRLRCNSLMSLSALRICAYLAALKTRGQS
jgi:hypothetical protein